MSDGAIVFIIMAVIAAVFLYAVRKGGPVPRRNQDAMMAGAAGDSSMPIDAGHHSGACDGGGHSGGGDAGSCDGGGGGHG